MFLDPESAIVERLQARVELADWGTGAKPRVLTAADAANMQERSQIAPALYVVFDAYAPTQQVGQGVIQEIEQDWIVYAVIRNARSHANAQGVRDDAGPLVDLILAALCGWKPGTTYGAMRLAPDSGPSFTDAGFGYFPLRFKTRTTVRGST